MVRRFAMKNSGWAIETLFFFAVTEEIARTDAVAGPHIRWKHAGVTVGIGCFAASRRIHGQDRGNDDKHESRAQVHDAVARLNRNSLLRLYPQESGEAIAKSALRACAIHETIAMRARIERRGCHVGWNQALSAITLRKILFLRRQAGDGFD